MDRKEAIEVVKNHLPHSSFKALREALETLIPELTEDEDERIRKKLITFFHKFPYTNLYDEDLNAKDVLSWLEKQGESKEKPTKEQVWDYCNKISHEWWQITMNKWKTLTDEEKDKYNQFIGFNDFSDMLMNITAGALFQLRDTGKLEYEEGSLLLEKPDDTPKPLEVTNAINEKQCEQEPAWSDAEAKEDLFNYTNILSAEENTTLENLINKLAVSGIKQYNTQAATILFKN